MLYNEMLHMHFYKKNLMDVPAYLIIFIITTLLQQTNGKFFNV